MPPLHLDWLDLPPGALALCRSPRLLAGRLHPADRAPILQAQVRLFVCLLHPDDVAQDGETLAQRQQAVEDEGIDFLSVPIPDYHPPSAQQLSALCSPIEATLAQGGRVLLHCRAGLGRTGTIAACLLVRRGVSADQAIQQVRAVRPGTVESEAQVGFIRAQVSR